MIGVCPLCESRGPVGQPCDQRPCHKRGYSFVPREYLPPGHGAIDPDIGRVIGGHLLVATLGGGGFGKVYIALQLPILMRTALKLVLPEALEGVEDALARFEAEARALARLSHPNVVRLLQYGVHGGKPFMVMELVEGGMTLKAELARRVVRGEELEGAVILDLLEQLLNGLEAAHALGIIHRDIKPENLMLQSVPGHQRLLKILDFGLVKELSDGSKTSQALGTPAYMAPEQVLRKNLGPWTDLYAVGAIAFELMTGRRAFSGPTPQAIVALKLDKAADPLAQVPDLDIPPLTATFLRRALAREPADRFRAVPEMRVALRAACAEVFAGSKSMDVSQLVSPSELARAREGDVTVPPDPGLSQLGLESTPGRSRRGRWIAVGLGVAGVAALVAVASGGEGTRERPDAYDVVPDVATPATTPAVVPVDAMVVDEIALDTRVADTMPTIVVDTVVEDLAPAEPWIAMPDVASSEPYAKVVARLDLQRRLVATNRWRPVQAAPAGTLLGLAPERRPATLATSLSHRARVEAPTRDFVMLSHAVSGDELALLEDGLAPPGGAPATGVPFELADRFCDAIGARLPTEGEWEWAARSTPDLGLGAHPEWTSTLWRDPETGATPPWVTAGGQTFRTIRRATADEGVFARERFCATGPCVVRTAAERPPVTFRCAVDK